MLPRPAHTFIAALLAATLSPALARAAEVDLSQTLLFGINPDTGVLWCYDFDESELIEIGPVTDSGGETLLDIHGSAFFSSFQQMHVFWTDPATGQTKMMLTDKDAASAYLDVVNLGSGRVTGAVAHTFQEPSPIPGIDFINRFKVYALQQAEGGDGVMGGININPNNSPQMEFEMELPDGTMYTRDDLKKDAPIDADGVLYEGPAVYVRVRPKGNGNQNGMMVNGQEYTVENGSVYEIISDSMTVRLQNARVHNGRAMGHWWIDITAETATINAEGSPPVEAEPFPVSGLLEIDTQTREIRQVQLLSREYDGLATEDGVIFYATSGKALYRIDTSSQMELSVKNLATGQNLGLEFHNGVLMVFEVVGDNLVPVDALTGTALGGGMDIGARDLGTIVFTDKLTFEQYD